MKIIILKAVLRTLTVLSIAAVASPAQANSECQGENANLLENIYVCRSSDLVEADYFQRLGNAAAEARPSNRNASHGTVPTS